MTTPRILATSGGFEAGLWKSRKPAGLVLEAIALSAHPEAARLAYLGTAMGDRPEAGLSIHEAFYGTTTEVSVVNVMPRPNFANRGQGSGVSHCPPVRASRGCLHRKPNLNGPQVDRHQRTSVD
jgi:hypothetical protein